MKLYYTPGACSLASHVALREIERTFELVKVDLRAVRTATGQDYRSINPKGHVPALQLDGTDSLVLTESPAVLAYIADLVPARRLAPAWGTFARYHLEEWLAVGTELHEQFVHLFEPDTPPRSEERARTTIAERFGFIASELAGRPYLLGETFTVADCYLFAIVRWCERFEIDLARWPTLAEHFRRVHARPSVQAALAAEGLLEPKRYRRTA